MDNQKEDSSKVKTHEEILKLINDVKLVEAKVKNPEQFKKDTIEFKAFLSKIEPPLQKPEEAIEEEQLITPTGEIPLKKKEEQKQSFLKRIEKPEIRSGKKTNWFSFLKKEKNDLPELEPSTEMEQQVQEIKIPRRTFILQLDNDGNLIGFPMKKSHPSKTTQQGIEEPEEAPVKGIKGKLRYMASMLRRKKSEESESSGGIGDKIKGIFKRKSEE